MEQVYIHTPLGITLIEGDENGITKILVYDKDMPVSKSIPSGLQQAVNQIKD